MRVLPFRVISSERLLALGGLSKQSAGKLSNVQQVVFGRGSCRDCSQTMRCLCHSSHAPTFYFLHICPHDDLATGLTYKMCLFGWRSGSLYMCQGRFKRSCAFVEKSEKCELLLPVLSTIPVSRVT